MPRPSQPWFWKQRQAWFVTINGERVPLGEDREEAFRRFHARMAAPKAVPIQPAGDKQLVAVLIDTFLDYVQKNLASDTYIWYQSRLQCWVTKYPKLTVEELKKHHVREWIDAMDVSPGTKRNYARSIQRCLAWCEEEDYIERSPIAKFKKPAGGKRERVVTSAEYGKILDLAGSDEFRDLIAVTWETGCRPQESLIVETRHVDLEHCRWFFPKSEAKGKRHDRVVYLNDKAMEITRRLMLAHPHGKLFRNSEGQPWTTDSVNCAFVRVQTRWRQDEVKSTRKPRQPIGEGELQARTAVWAARRKQLDKQARAKGEKFCLYHLRHTWMNRMLTSGVDSLTVAVLAGHVDPSTLATTYQHLSQNSAYLLSEARRVS